MCEKIRIRIVSDYPSIRGGLEDILIMENMTNDLILVQIRVNGYLLDFASIEGQRQKHHRLQNIQTSGVISFLLLTRVPSISTAISLILINFLYSFLFGVK